MFSTESKQSKIFCDLALKVLPGSTRKDVRAVYKSIKHGQSKIYENVQSAIQALEQKMKMDLVIESYNNFINDSTLFTNDERRRAESYFRRSIHSNGITRLLIEIETVFNIQAPFIFTDIGLYADNSGNTVDTASTQRESQLLIDKANSISKSMKNKIFTQTMSWKHIVECIRHEMSAVISTSMEAAVTAAKVVDLSDESVVRVLREMQKRINLSNTEALYIKNAVQRARKYKEAEDLKGIVDVRDLYIYNIFNYIFGHNLSCVILPTYSFPNQ